MSKALYRKYRPKSLDEVIGQEQITNILKKSIEQNKISHAYLFIGPRGTGKTSVARIFAHQINNFNYDIEDEYVDIIEIDGASNRGIDNIRELRERANIAPTAGKYKIYIIDEVHMLTKEAFNALLKTLEEPPSHVIFIMATTDAYKVPVTITSRAQTYNFKLADSDTMFSFLKNISGKEKINIADDALKIIVKQGGGSFRDSLSLLDQISTISADEITKEVVISAMGLPEDEEINNLINSYIEKDANKIISTLKNLFSNGTKPETIAEEILKLIIEDPKPELIPLLEKLPDIKAPFAEAKILIALIENNYQNIKPVNNGFVKKEEETPREVKEVREAKEIEEIKKDESARNEQKVFDWKSFLEKVKDLNDAVYSQLKSCDFEVSNGVLEIYPKKKISKTILSRDNNKKILVDASGWSKIKICEVGDGVHGEKDELISKMSAIMGGEVKNDGGENPF